jgi:hypothetical protein
MLIMLWDLGNKTKQMELGRSSKTVLLILCTAHTSVFASRLLEPVSFYVDSLR